MVSEDKKKKKLSRKHGLLALANHISPYFARSCVKKLGSHLLKQIVPNVVCKDLFLYTLAINHGKT